MTKLLALGFSALVLGATGCLLVGFDPLDDNAGGASGPSQSGGTGGAGGSRGMSATGGTGVSGSGGGAGGVSGAGAGGREPDASVAPRDGGGVPEPDAGPPTACTGMPDDTACDDGAYCTTGDRCVGGRCMPGVAMQCGDECNATRCDDLLRTCTAVPVLNGTDCGVLGVCLNGLCNTQLLTCGDYGNCQPLCDSSMCAFDCEDANSCATTCRDGAECATNCTGADTCEFECSNNSTCEFDCTSTGTCTGYCEGDSRCEVDCTAAGGCDDFVCLNGAECKITCDPFESCGFAECWDQPQECEPGVVICGSDCYDWR